MLIDTHAHLDYPEFQEDFAGVLERAQAAGVTRIISIGTSVESSRRAVALAEKYPMIYAAIGVHPTSVLEAEEDVLTPLRELAKSPRVVAIGETGLDYHRLPGSESERKDGAAQLSDALQNEVPSQIEASIRDGAYKAAQAGLFEQQLDLACELGLNVVIHQRDAWDDTLEILRAYSGRVRGVFHCFGGPPEQADEVIALGHMVSFTGIVTFKNAPLVHETAAKTGGERYMVETDCPYLAPVPYRGKRCEPAYTRLVAETVARLRGETLEQVAAQTTRNAEGFFRFP
jgi:TatD DNase family protein